MKRVYLFLLLWLIVHVAYSQESYIVFSAEKLPETERQPTWISVVRRPGFGQHVPLNNSLIALEPGIYRLNHVDFGGSPFVSNGTIRLPQEGLVRFEVLPNTITLVGTLRIELERPRLSGHLYNMEIVITEQLLAKACLENQSLLESLPIRIPTEEGGFRSININCE